eukprot:gnl/TRDRNA2_/TRDRNA2_181522_c0_seq1.p1 gnl/TRDRNA2_/TRDRNA2_181522_c0~~gnl/TRDRNA2_/TRDRNA2_181522_c0_seq1.p1  ORF type:complete len:279 (-),score=98.56 gnl/TRDRNA2_/TRDRNA2_181522_c0_seq1:191-940(-)
MGADQSTANGSSDVIRSDACRVCSSKDPATDTVKVNTDALNEEKRQKEKVEAEKLAREARLKAELEENRRRQEEEEARKRQEALQRAREESEKRIREEAARREQEEQERMEAERKREEEERKKREQELEQARRQREEAAKAEAAERERQAAEAKAKVESFLKQRKFKSVDDTKGTLSKTTPLHTAVKEKDAQMVGLLLWAGADPERKVSGKTPRAIAEKSNKKGSHDQVLSALSTPRAAAPPLATRGGC